jgi:hypothetical protein
MVDVRPFVARSGSEVDYPLAAELPEFIVDADEELTIIGADLVRKIKVLRFGRRRASGGIRKWEHHISGCIFVSAVQGARSICTKRCRV